MNNIEKNNNNSYVNASDYHFLRNLFEDDVLFDVPILQSASRIKDHIIGFTDSFDECILSGNALVLSLPVIQPVEPPGVFEAGLRNFSAALDATLTPIVGAASTLLSSAGQMVGDVIEGVGSGIGTALKGVNPLSWIALAAAAVLLIPPFINVLGRENKSKNDKGNFPGINRKINEELYR